ncbi:hypothetical protein MLD38_010194 [Melastoma candidum]|uniref:Uncharacterized protein n=1 Tax=Melastoma candidum TaxID=119954 RepID=A0ACB9R350_9MYRT|nr:hypothetical protein MLD38_010194 [Melastoma candidum]
MRQPFVAECKEHRCCPRKLLQSLFAYLHYPGYSKSGWMGCNLGRDCDSRSHPHPPCDFEENDEIYDAVRQSERDGTEKGGDLDKERKDRTLDEMAEEAEEYQKLLS